MGIQGFFFDDYVVNVDNLIDNRLLNLLNACKLLPEIC